ncbi:gamma-glutamyl-gamma-aminobutyrate hydrolase family protein [Mycolicibacterium sp. YH-1]|uniref:gamma-glutamyl-gamma-aminobutyrate hydrolase family protein n=1 Tax=Mycolicibacterium sp. YH-1 TaxID=2908837 RepID=UPI001F4C26EF|nr:gamma-glutamyl-gamma-aminobutyrate hydrolase family protein [Mycolicibacterium sp. YH-1]UNB52592.1 gamma-glutamyl-gamma-aminobutyrate hydrolase family protein [Mycolicibacterium sp. YH-1]
MTDSRQPAVAVTLDFEVFERYHHWREMLGGIVTSGASPLTIDCRHPRTDLEHLIGMVDGLILLGGSDVNPELYGGDGADPLVNAAPRALDDNEMAALHIALRRGIPVLAVCRGAQLTNVALDGTLFADLVRDRPSHVVHRTKEEDLDGAAHNVDIHPDTLLATWLGGAGRIPVNSYHHQGFATLAPSVRAAATAEDGLVEAFEIAAANLVALQWHPEILWPSDVHSANLMRSFVECCADRSRLNTARS